MDAQIAAVQRMQDYIESHLHEPITPADLARAARYSPWYADRLFRKWTGLSPAAYIRRLRLSKSALLLRDKPVTVTDVALNLGFGSVDGYQRAFLRTFGCNPHTYSKHPTPIPLFTPYGVQYRNERKVSQMEPIQTVFVHVIDKPARKVIIKRGVKATDYFSYCEEIGCDIWGLLTSIPSLTGEPICLWLPEAYRMPGTSVYVQGVEVDADSTPVIPEGCGMIALPACRYLMFQGEPFDEADYCAAVDHVQHAMETYDPSLHGFAWDDSNPRLQLEPIGTRGYIELRAVRTL